MGDFRLSRYWDRQLETDLPDCRLPFSQREKRVVKLGRMEMDTVFCVSCGNEKGLVPVHCPHVFFLCDDCFAKMGRAAPPGAVEIEDPSAPRH